MSRGSILHLGGERCASFCAGDSRQFRDLWPSHRHRRARREASADRRGRTYLSDREWQEAVLGWIDESLLIVRIAGSTQWIQWELHRILEKERSRHLLILIPPDRESALLQKLERVSSRKDRWANVLASLADTEWSLALRSIDIEGSCTGPTADRAGESARHRDRPHQGPLNAAPASLQKLARTSPSRSSHCRGRRSGDRQAPKCKWQREDARRFRAPQSTFGAIRHAGLAKY